MNKVIFLLLIELLAIGLSSVGHASPTPKPGFNFKELSLSPVLSGGRLKPFDELSRETILTLTGSRSFAGFQPTEFFLSLMVHPGDWANEPIILVNHEEVRRQLLLEPTKKYFTPHELLKNNVFLQYAEGITSGNQVSGTQANPVATQSNARTDELKRVVERVNTFQAVVQGRHWNIGPDAVLADGMKTPTPQSQAVYEVLKSYLDSNPVDFEAKAMQARLQLESVYPEFINRKNHLTAEVLYNKLRPFLQAMIFYLLAGILWLVSRIHFARMMAKFLTITAVLVHVFGFALRCYVSGRPPVTNMYESIIWVSLGVMLFSTILYVKFKQVILMSTATLLSGLALFAADAAPLMMDPTIRPLVPVLRSNYWLTIHVLTITLSYAAFMLAMGISNTTLFLFLKKSQGAQSVAISQRIATLNLLSYRATQFGVVFLAAGTILGGIWADYSWGRFWGWDPKEVWALIALLAYTAVLHGRFAGWVGTFAFPQWTVICFSTVLMAWYGVNFVLGVGLHSYGFSSGGQGVVALFLALQFAYCGFVYFRQKNTKENAKSESI